MTMIENKTAELSRDIVENIEEAIQLQLYKINYRIHQVERDWKAIVCATSQTDAIDKISEGKRVDIGSIEYIGQIHALSNDVKIYMGERYGFEVAEHLKEVEKEKARILKKEIKPINVIKEKENKTKTWKLW